MRICHENQNRNTIIYAIYTPYIGDLLVQAMINIPKEENRILNIVKAKHNLRTKSEAISLVVKEYGSALLEPELRPDYVKKLSKLRKEKGKEFKGIKELRQLIEG